MKGTKKAILLSLSMLCVGSMWADLTVQRPAGAGVPPLPPSLVGRVTPAEWQAYNASLNTLCGSMQQGLAGLEQLPADQAQADKRIEDLCKDNKHPKSCHSKVKLTSTMSKVGHNRMLFIPLCKIMMRTMVQRAMEGNTVIKLPEAANNIRRIFTCPGFTCVGFFPVLKSVVSSLPQNIADPAGQIVDQMGQTYQQLLAEDTSGMLLDMCANGVAEALSNVKIKAKGKEIALWDGSKDPWSCMPPAPAEKTKTIVGDDGQPVAVADPEGADMDDFLFGGPAEPAAAPAPAPKSVAASVQKVAPTPPAPQPVSKAVITPAPKGAPKPTAAPAPAYDELS